MLIVLSIKDEIILLKSLIVREILYSLLIAISFLYNSCLISLERFKSS